ncbi:MAG: hypothetical protein HC828_03190 [Blastochloris sp.]|nr:hypothetical protein [Blastochloris sp.]
MPAADETKTRRPAASDAMPYALSTQTAISDVLDHPQAEALSVQLQDLARRYMGARRRSAEALLETARWLQEARTLAEQGEWYTFLEVTGTSHDLAERLLNIHRATEQYPQFRAAVLRGHLNQTVAALLARPSTPPEAIEQLVERETPPRVTDVRQVLLTLREQLTDAIPHYAGSEIVTPHYAGSSAPSVPPPTWVAPLQEEIARIRRRLSDATADPAALDHPIMQEVQSDLTDLLEAVQALLARIDTER